MTLWPLYRAVTLAATPLAAVLLARRAGQGKEEPARLGERWGRSALLRPAGELYWLHGASVGESLSLLPLVERLLAGRPGASALVTTGTVSSARLLAERLPTGRAWHQYLPLDQPRAVGRFLDRWRPDLALWVESEIWPNLILETRRRGIPMALLNARMSERTWRGWRRAPRLIGELLGCFDLVLAQDAVQAARLEDLGAGSAETVGDLKGAGAPAPVSAERLERHRALIGERPAWLAASTHPREEAVVAAAHRLLRRRFPDLITLLAPRHVARAGEIAALLAGEGLAVARRSLGETPDAATDIWLIDTMGELGLFQRLAPIVLVAGSLGIPGSVGGHNPLEAAGLGCAVLHGPDMMNAAAATARLDAAGAALRVDDAASLAAAVTGLLAEPARRHAMGEAGLAVAAAERGVVDAVLARLAPLLPAGAAIAEKVADAGA